MSEETYNPAMIKIQEAVNTIEIWEYSNWRIKAMVKTKLQEAFLLAWELDNNNF
jgi:hypothetical protein